MERESIYLNTQKKRFHSGVKKIDGTLASILRAEKEGCLFHGSPFKNLPVIQTRKSRLDKRPVLFAGKPWAAISFTAVWDDRDIEQGTISGEPYMRLKRRGILDIYKNGGYLYQLPPTNFIQTDLLTMYEFISYADIVPIAVAFIRSPVKLMEELGVKFHDAFEDKPDSRSSNVFKKW